MKKLILISTISLLSLQSIAEISVDCKNQLNEVMTHRALIKKNVIEKKLKASDGKNLLANTDGYAEYVSLSCGALGTLRKDNLKLKNNENVLDSESLKTGEKIYEEAIQYFKKNK